MNEKIERVVSLFEEHYGKPKPFRLNDPIDLLVETILSQNTNDKNMLKAFSALKNKYQNYEQVMNSEESDLAKTIYSSGFYNLKAQRIQKSLKKVNEDFGVLNLDSLKDKTKEEAFNYLVSLNGVGPKTAAIILTFGLNHNSIPVDTHVYRVSKRLGIVPSNRNRVSAQDFLEENTRNAIKNLLHQHLIKHGREICHARNPECNNCFLTKECEYFKNK